ncbi:response regulator transcription factor [Alkalicoccus luteus]|uniref:Response regulator transcription factor n=1 Tax=Alkalicoccus luteus TaxID=1237094 RepID=A0A969PNR9_9BACI|nr:response regulator transcription factor [Alkalicoccus luteus]NJP36780.1 response regulator transcription factor [Alkalicoccus luteus]
MKERSVLILETDLDLLEKLKQSFSGGGFIVWAETTVREAEKTLLHRRPDGIVVSAVLDEESGLDFCRHIRSDQNWTPLIMLTESDDELDCVLSLELGADDYVMKPVRYKEAVARMKSVLRRGELCCTFTQVETDDGMIIRNGRLLIDLNQHSVFVEEEWVEMTKREFELLLYLMQHPDRSFSRGDLLEAVSDVERDLDERIIDVFISRLRQKIEPNKRNPTYIKTVRGVGYMMRSQEQGRSRATNS